LIDCLSQFTLQRGNGLRDSGRESALIDLDPGSNPKNRLLLLKNDSQKTDLNRTRHRMSDWRKSRRTNSRRDRNIRVYKRPAGSCHRSGNEERDHAGSFRCRERLREGSEPEAGKAVDLHGHDDHCQSAHPPLAHCRYARHCVDRCNRVGNPSLSVSKDPRNPAHIPDVICCWSNFRAASNMLAGISAETGPSAFLTTRPDAFQPFRWQAEKISESSRSAS